MSRGGEKAPLLGNINDHDADVNTNQKFEWWERPSDSSTQQIHIDLLDSSPDAGSTPHGTAPGRPIGSEDEIGTLAVSQHEEEKLGEFFSTAISGNDITSSVLYVAGTAAAVCGVWAPIATLIVAFVLALFRPIYHEVVTALPMNGGAYNVLLNTTTKKLAAVAAALTILSYTATAVVSAYSAMSYLKTVWSFAGDHLVAGTIIILAFFMLLNLIGITESAVVAGLLFVVHLATLFLLIGWSLVHCFTEDGRTNLRENVKYWNQPPPNSASYSLGVVVYLGYSSAMLGITGFETSANFVEQQLPGVFPKTLRNMWAAVAFFNPVISFLVFAVLKYEDVINPANSNNLLALMGSQLHPWLGTLISIDAVFVLCGAVLTAYVGVTGLLRRLALDRVIFQILLAENKLRHTNHWIIIGFFLITSSLILIIQENALVLGGVYTSAFLCVMTLFSVGNMLLKYKRSKLPREVVAPWPVVILAAISVIAGFIGNAITQSSVLVYFLMYFVITMLFIAIMLTRVSLLKLLLYFAKRIFSKKPSIQNSIAKNIQKVNDTKMVFFAKTDSIAALNKAVLYVRDNEQTNWLLIVHVYSSRENVPARLAQNVHLLDEAYPKMRIDLVLVHGEFGPTLVDRLTHKLSVPKNFMFITCPGETFTHKISDLGGVRMVTH